MNAFKYDTEPALATVGDLDAEPLHLAESQKPYLEANGMDKPWGGSQTTGRKEAERWVGRSYKLWKQWTGYLVRESLIPRNQLSTDDFAGWLAYQTNLALKGIIGIRAMAEIAETVGETEDAKYYLNISETYIQKWQEYGISRDKTHAKLAYDWYGSWTTLYNLFADSLLCFHIPKGSRSQQEQSANWQGPSNQAPVQDDTAGETASSVFIPDRIYKIQSDWYHNVLQRYGLPLDSRHLYTKSDWEFFAAAISSKSTRKEILDSVAKWVNETATGMLEDHGASRGLRKLTNNADNPFADLYDTEGDGGYPGLAFKARPVVGGHFSFLALERACGGKAVEALEFLNTHEAKSINVQEALDADRPPPAAGMMPEAGEMGEL